MTEVRDAAELRELYKVEQVRAWLHYTEAKAAFDEHPEGHPFRSTFALIALSHLWTAHTYRRLGHQVDVVA